MSDYTGKGDDDGSMAHYAALDALRRGEGESGAYTAARVFLRPGSVLGWLEQGIAQRAVQSAIEEFKRKLAEALTKGE